MIQSEELLFPLAYSSTFSFRREMVHLENGEFFLTKVIRKISFRYHKRFSKS